MSDGVRDCAVRGVFVGMGGSHGRWEEYERQGGNAGMRGCGRKGGAVMWGGCWNRC